MYKVHHDKRFLFLVGYFAELMCVKYPSSQERLGKKKFYEKIFACSATEIVRRKSAVTESFFYSFEFMFLQEETEKVVQALCESCACNSVRDTLRVYGDSICRYTDRKKFQKVVNKYTYSTKKRDRKDKKNLEILILGTTLNEFLLSREKENAPENSVELDMGATS